MEKSTIEKRICDLLLAMYPKTEYTASVTAAAIVDLLIAEDLLRVVQPKSERHTSPGERK